MGLETTLLDSPRLEHDGELELELVERRHADPARGLVPAYIFAMRNRKTRAVMGRIALRIGDNDYLRMYAGHIGYSVERDHRGSHLAERSCRLLLPLARLHGFTELWVTCNPENAASRRTLERLGAELIEIVDVPPGNDMYTRGERSKCRYRLTLEDTRPETLSSEQS
jgi:predicted acetyltransferase